MKLDRNLIFKIGITLVIISTFFISVLPGSLYFYGLPFFTFLLGLILVWSGKRKIMTKILYTITPILFFFSYQYLFKFDNLSLCSRQQTPTCLPLQLILQLFSEFNFKFNQVIKCYVYHLFNFCLITEKAFKMAVLHHEA